MKLLLILLLAQQPQDLFLSPWQAPAGRHCQVMSEPSRVRLPAFGVNTLPAEFPNPSGSVVMSWLPAPEPKEWQAEYGPRPDVLTIVESTVNDSVARQVRDATLKTLQDAVDSVPLLIRVDLYGAPIWRVARALECPPDQTDGPDMNAYKAQLRRFGGRHQAVVKFVVRADGKTTHASIAESSGDPEFDTLAMRISGFLRYQPLLINRVPVPALVNVPVRVNLPAR